MVLGRLSLLGGLGLLRGDQTSLFEELAQTLLINWLAQEVVHARLFRLLLILFSLVGRDTTDERLCFLRHVLVHVLLYPHACLDTSTLRHTVV